MPVDQEIDTKALSAAIAGFLACHILTCRFLVQEGVIDKDRFTSFLEMAMTKWRLASRTSGRIWSEPVDHGLAPTGGAEGRAVAARESVMF